MTAHSSEFSIEGGYRYDRRSSLRWLLSHLWQHKWFVFGGMVGSLISQIFYAQAQVMIGRAAEEIINPTAANGLLIVSLITLGVFVMSGVTDWIRSISLTTLAQRLEASTRREFYLSLLGKSQTFHDRQRPGDLMAMATDDVAQMNFMINPGALFLIEIVLGFTVPVFFMALLDIRLLLVPLLFIGTYILAVRAYSNQLNPVAYRQRERFSKMNTAAEEIISGIEIVKASAQESFERRRFMRNAQAFRDLFVKQGFIEARYLPMLFFGIALGLGFMHALYLYQIGEINLAALVGFISLFAILRFPTIIALFSFTLIQIGMAGADRMLNIINTETELDQNTEGHAAPVDGDIRFENVSFGYEDGMVLHNLNFHIAPGQTIAIVGGTGSGKSTLTELINRTYDSSEGRILIDGIDVRDWSLQSLRSQISRIEQDVFLFSRSVGDNIAFGAPNATQEQIETAARAAQAHEFIMSFSEGYQTVVGERGVMLSGGQRQRIALARAFLNNPRILVLDDSTSAIDSKTEDEIQKAIRAAQEGRTMLLITHRLSQIRWADAILVMDAGRIVAYGKHEDLLRQSRPYRRIFARYDVELPPLETDAVPA